MSDGIRDGFRNPLVTGVSIPDGTIDTNHIADGAVSSTKIDTNLQSDNYDGGVIGSNPGTVGWRIERNTGDAVFNDVIVRGTIIASAGQITGALTMGGSITMQSGGAILFTRNSTAMIKTNHSPQNGDFWIQYSAGGSVGRIQGLTRTGGVELVQAELQIVSGAFEIAQGQFHIRSGIIDSPLGNDLVFRVSGATAASFDNLGHLLMASGNNIYTNGGSVSAPGYSRNGDSDTGFYFPDANQVAVTTGGTVRTWWNVDDIRIYSINNVTTGAAANVFINSSTSLMARSTSSARYKDRIRDWDHRDSVLNLRPRLYHSRARADDARKVRLGLIAEEVAESFPLARVDLDGRPDGVDWNVVTTGIIAELKSVVERLTRLESDAHRHGRSKR